MAKQLKDILAGVKSSKKITKVLGKDPGVDYRPKSKDEADWADKHEIERHEDRVGNGDDVYQATNVKYSLTSPKEDKHGMEKPKDKAVYEAKKVEEADKAGYYLWGSQKKKKFFQAPKDKDGKTDIQKWAEKKAAERQAKQAVKEAKEVEEAVCNETPAGKTCPVHGVNECSMTMREDEIEEKYIGFASLKRRLATMHEEKHVFHVHLPSDDTRLHKMVGHDVSEPIGKKPKGERLKITVPGDRRTATNKAAQFVARTYGTNVKFKYSHKVDEDLAVPLLGGADGDESAEMAKTQLRALANKAMHLATQLGDEQVVEPWVQAKIAVAKDNVSAVHDYMIYGDHNKPEDEQTSPYDGGVDMSGSPRNTYPNFSVDVNTGRNV